LAATNAVVDPLGPRRYRAGVPAKILLVDDNEELLALLARLVEAEGWIPIAVGKGKTALEKIQAEKPLAAVVDVLPPT